MFNSFPQPKPDSGGGSNIKSIQRGMGSLSTASGVSVAIPITAVDPTKSIALVFFKTTSASATTAARNVLISIEITNATTITIAKNNATDTIEYVWQVIEFNNVKSLQKGTTAVNAATVNVALSSVNPAKSIVFISSTNSNTATDNASIFYTSFLVAELTSATNLQFRSNDIGFTTKWFVIEFV